MNLNREILRLSVPAILSNITVPLLGLSDTAISGHLGSESFLASMSVGAMSLNVIFWLFGFLRMGTTGLTATEFGNENQRGIAMVFRRSIVLASVIGILLILFQSPLLKLLEWIIQPSENVRELAQLYFRICIWESPALLVIMVVSGWLIGLQTTFWPMVIAISVNVINIATSIFLVFFMEVGFCGVAFGTLVANWAGAIMSLAIAARQARGIPLFSGWKNTFTRGALGKFFSVNADLFLRSACIMGVTLAMTAFGSRLGALTLAVNAVAMQFFHFFSFFMDGYAFTGEALVGRYTGAGNTPMLKKSVRHLLAWSAGLAALFFLIYFFAETSITSLLTDVSEVREGVSDISLWICLIPPVTVSAFIFDGFYIGATATRKMLIASLASAAVFFAVAMPDTYLGADSAISPNGILWTAFLSYLATRGLILGILWPSASRINV